MTIKTEDEFIALVKKAEHEAETNPRAYTTKIALFALLGYAVIFMVLVTLFGLAGGLIATAFYSSAILLLLIKKKLIIAVLAGIWITLRALWVKFLPPEGYKLTRKEYPELFAELDVLSKQLKSLKIHEVLLDSRLNAAIVQHPRLGVLGWHKNYLILGYQLMLMLSPEEMRSVLAHEFGHLSGNHSRFNGWIYRVRHTWERVMAAFDENESWSGRLLGKFFDWYTPKFDAYSFALARRNEYEADAISAGLTTPETASRALVNVHAMAPYIDKSYWENYFHDADRYEKPPHAPFAGLGEFIKTRPLGREEMLKRIKEEMQVETKYADTHPSLKDRVDALDAVPQLPVPPKQNAAEAWLGERNQKIMNDFDQRWLHDNAESWKSRFEYVTHARSKISEYKQANSADLSDEDLWNYAYWTNEFEGSDAALPLFRRYQERYPNDPDPAFFIGMTLLDRGDAAGLEELRIARNSASLIERTAYAGYEFLKQRGEEEQADAWWKESIKANEIFIAANSERESVTLNDTLEYPQIDDELLQQLVAKLKQQKKVGLVWLAQKKVEYFPENPVYIIAFNPKGLAISTDSIQKAVAENLEVDGDFFVVCKGGDTKALAKKVIKAGQRII